mmetsp:Transcript_39908/g.120129  ORF Transcript_39908/g.120129 Transcript_39908/m.120129 type:complete len:242 (+) Transcript_39908:320-1045(+)
MRTGTEGHASGQVSIPRVVLLLRSRECVEFLRVDRPRLLVPVRDQSVPFHVAQIVVHDLLERPIQPFGTPRLGLLRISVEGRDHGVMRVSPSDRIAHHDDELDRVRIRLLQSGYDPAGIEQVRRRRFAREAGGMRAQFRRVEEFEAVIPSLPGRFEGGVPPPVEVVSLPPLRPDDEGMLGEVFVQRGGARLLRPQNQIRRARPRSLVPRTIDRTSRLQESFPPLQFHPPRRREGFVDVIQN